MQKFFWLKSTKLVDLLQIYYQIKSEEIKKAIWYHIYVLGFLWFFLLSLLDYIFTTENCKKTKSKLPKILI